MSEQENLRIMQKLFEAANAHDVDRIVELVDDAYVAESDTLPGLIAGARATGSSCGHSTKLFRTFAMTLSR